MKQATPNTGKLSTSAAGTNHQNLITGCRPSKLENEKLEKLITTIKEKKTKKEGKN